MRASDLANKLNELVNEHGDCMVLIPCQRGQKELEKIKFEPDVELEDVDDEGNSKVMFEDIFVVS